MERLRPGVVLSERYRLIGHVASGGMGQVWEALDDVLQRRVALKIMHPHTQDEIRLAERFKDEARFAAQLVHPNIVTIHDYIEFEGLSFLVMEMVDGLTLGELLARGPLTQEQVRTMLFELASALVVAHDAGIIHRDIKPANVLISETGAKLTDFGIARSVEGHSHTITGQLLGTAHYLSPEHALGQQLGPASDIYGLGVLAHEMLTGVKPFDRGSPIATALAHVQDPPPPLPAGTPEDLVELVAACLAKEPGDRPSAEQIARMLEAPAPAATEALEVVDPDATMALPVLPRRGILQN
ncbi:serine/threonine protein kinase [Tessaracoccus sp. OS52]|uniref:serine/threonine-protein kinase n=1 Tax=Tessaracoccus sp. OS52 TaxID=2886691 RepID=UPI001D126827|nr:serine/threonine protein kinase [Tessaracoccus sp. OS52]